MPTTSQAQSRPPLRERSISSSRTARRSREWRFPARNPQGVRSDTGLAQPCVVVPAIEAVKRGAGVASVWSRGLCEARPARQAEGLERFLPWPTSLSRSRPPEPVKSPYRPHSRCLDRSHPALLHSGLRRDAPLGQVGVAASSRKRRRPCRSHPHRHASSIRVGPACMPASKSTKTARMTKIHSHPVTPRPQQAASS
jgi:hypothetical protein